jgi:hypothetical protein
MDISEFKRLNETSSYSRHPWEIARGRVLLHMLSRYIPQRPTNLVDIGSGDAYVINLACQHEVARSYFAIDIAYTPEIVDQLEKNNSHSPISYFPDMAAFRQKGVPEGETLYLCMDVLEHLKDEREVLDLIVPSSATGKGGAPVATVPAGGASKAPAFYFFSVPAFQSVFSNHDVLLGHYRRYTVAQFRELLTRQGLSVIDSGYFFFTLLIARWFEKKLLRKKDYSIDNWAGSPFKTRLLTGILSLDFSISRILKKVGIRLPGLSCYCICQL